MTIRQLPVAPAGARARVLPVNPYRQRLTAGTVGSELQPIMTTPFLFLMLLGVITGMKGNSKRISGALLNERRRRYGEYQLAGRRHVRRSGYL
jgi:hypothetical protein